MLISQTEGSICSADGTSIGFIKLGTGPSIVIVHGSLATGNEWIPFASVLSDRYTCYLMDRRGHGRSGDSASYSIDKECEDIDAVLNEAGRNAYLLAHSYGAACTMELTKKRDVSKLILYEPPLPIHDTVIDPAFARVRSASEQRDFDGALTIGLRHLVKMEEKEISRRRRTPLWTEMTSLIPTLIRECEALDQLEQGVGRFAGLSVPTLLLVGTSSVSIHVEASQALAEVLPGACLVELKDQGHQAHLTATNDFAAEVIKFLG